MNFFQGPNECSDEMKDTASTILGFSTISKTFVFVIFLSSVSSFALLWVFVFTTWC